MLQGIIVKKILDSIMKQLLKQFKLDKIQAYVEKPNELDKQMKQVQKNLSKYGKYIEDLEKEVAILKDITSKTESIKNKFNKILK
jgi:conjugal transfer/entry exclusion protein